MIEAVVQAGAFQTSYRRAGRGRTVLLVLSSEDQVLADSLFATLAEQFRTIAPATPPELQNAAWRFDAWLCSLSDGLGLERPAVVAGVGHADALTSLASRDPERLGPLVLLHHKAGSTPGIEAAQAPTGQVGRSPVRVVAVPASEDQSGRALVLAGIVEFLHRPADAVAGPAI